MSRSMRRPSAIGVSVSCSPQMSSTGRCSSRQQRRGRSSLTMRTSVPRIDPGCRAIVGRTLADRRGVRPPDAARRGSAGTARPHGAPCTSERARRLATSGAGGCPALACQHHPLDPPGYVGRHHDPDAPTVGVADQVTALDPETVEQRDAPGGVVVDRPRRVRLRGGAEPGKVRNDEASPVLQAIEDRVEQLR